MKNIDKRTLFIGLGFLMAGLLLGWIFFGGKTEKTEQREEEALTEHRHEEGTTWTCSMHPQIREEEPGQCPICGMDLIPVGNMEAEEVSDNEIQMTQAAMKIANVQTATVQKASPTKEIYLPGKVKADERRIAEITSRFGGRIEKLFVNFTGQQVKRGQRLASIYSPKLVTAQKELFEAAKFRESNPSYYEAAVNKLKLWDLTEAQIQNILETKEVEYNFNVLSPQSGTVVTRNTSQGDYVQEGESLFEVANLDKVWLLFDAYESDLPWIREGDEINFTVQSLPGKTFSSKITFIDPVIDPQTRVASVRTEVSNPNDQLKPEMFATGMLQASLDEVKNVLVIPKSSVLWTGKRAVVYVKKHDFSQPTFEYREVVLGPEAGAQYVVMEGLQEGEEIVANGVFKVDAAAQLQGKVSMMNPGTRSPEGGKVSTGHDHGGMDMEGEISTSGQHNMGKSTEVDQKFKQQLADVLNPYLALKNALVASDAAKAATAARQTQQSLKKVDMTLLKGDAHQQWINYLNKMQKALNTIQSDAELAAQRTAFAPLSEALYQGIQQFNVTGLDVYYQYCPMADNNQGAYWLSDIKEIRNPYFGDKMLKCGSVKQEL